VSIKVRLSGEPDEITAIIQHLHDEFDVAGGERSYPNRGSFGVRMYLEVRPRTDNGPRQVRSERVQPHRSPKGEIRP
jgi:hypothetical protein